MLTRLKGATGVLQFCNSADELTTAMGGIVSVMDAGVSDAVLAVEAKIIGTNATDGMPESWTLNDDGVPVIAIWIDITDGVPAVATVDGVKVRITATDGGSNLAAVQSGIWEVCLSRNFDRLDALQKLLKECGVEERRDVQATLNNLFDIKASIARNSATGLTNQLMSLRYSAVVHGAAGRKRRIAQRTAQNAGRDVTAALQELPAWPEADDVDMQCFFSQETFREAAGNPTTVFGIGLSVTRTEFAVDEPTANKIGPPTTSFMTGDSFAAATKLAIATHGQDAVYGNLAHRGIVTHGNGNDVINAWLPLALNAQHAMRALLVMPAWLGHFVAADTGAFSTKQYIVYFQLLGEIVMTVLENGEREVLLFKAVKRTALAIMEAHPKFATTVEKMMNDFVNDPTKRQSDSVHSLVVIVGIIAAFDDKPEWAECWTMLRIEAFRRRVGQLFKNNNAGRLLMIERLMGIPYGYDTLSNDDAVALFNENGPFPARGALVVDQPSNSPALCDAIDDEDLLSSETTVTLKRRTTTDALAAAGELFALPTVNIAAAELAAKSRYDLTTMRSGSAVSNSDALMEGAVDKLLCIAAQALTGFSNSAVKLMGPWHDPGINCVAQITASTMHHLSASATAANNADRRNKQHMAAVAEMARAEDIAFFEQGLMKVVKGRHRYYDALLKEIVATLQPKWCGDTWKWIPTTKLSSCDRDLAKAKLSMMTTSRTFHRNAALIPRRYQKRLEAVLGDAYHEVMAEGRTAVEGRHKYRDSNIPNRHGYSQSNRRDGLNSCDHIYDDVAKH